MKKLRGKPKRGGHNEPAPYQHNIHWMPPYYSVVDEP
jgi:hypothetical protein